MPQRQLPSVNGFQPLLCGFNFPAGHKLYSVSDFVFNYDREHNRTAEKSIRAGEARHGKGNCLYSTNETKHDTAFCTGYSYN